MFGVKYLENPWREKFDFFSKKFSGVVFRRVEKWGSWLESFRSKKSFVTQVLRVPKKNARS